LVRLAGKFSRAAVARLGRGEIIWGNCPLKTGGTLGVAGRTTAASLKKTGRAWPGLRFELSRRAAGAARRKPDYFFRAFANG
jgi:hypothetical protein